jgi:hypothetical protein
VSVVPSVPADAAVVGAPAPEAPAMEERPGPRPRTFGVSWPMVVGLVAFAGTVATTRSSRLLVDPDTYWHLGTGRWIVAHGRVPTADPFSHTVPGRPWVAHEWLTEIVFFGLKSAFGWTGLTVAVAASLAVTLAYLTRFLLARMKPIHALLFVTLTAGLVHGHLLARPHVFAWLILVTWVGTITNAVEARRGPPWPLLVLLPLWANLHASFTLGIALGVPLAVEAVLAAPACDRRHALRAWSAFIAVMPILGLATPAGLSGLVYTFQVMNMSTALEVIGEWQSPDFHHLQMLEVWLLLLLGVAVLGRIRLPVIRLLVVLGLIHLALTHQRDIAILGLITPLLLAAPFGSRMRELPVRGQESERMNRFFEAVAIPARRGAIAGAAVLAGLIAVAGVRMSGVAPATAITPDAAFRAARAAGAHGPVLNTYSFGGYLVYQGEPVFIDGRADMYGDELLKRELDALNLASPDDLPRLLDDYHIGWTLLDTGTPAAVLLDHMPGWRRVYADDVAVVHVRGG